MTRTVAELKSKEGYNGILYFNAASILKYLFRVNQEANEFVGRYS